VRTVVKELRRLGPIICDGRPVALPLEWFGPEGEALPPQLVRTLDYYGELFMLVANPSDRPIHAQVRGASRVNRHAYDVSVFLGQHDLSVRQPAPDELPTITVGPRGSGTFLLHRRPLLPETDEQ